MIAFVVVALVALVGLRFLAASGIVVPRLSASEDQVLIDGVAYRRVQLRNDAPTAVTVHGVRRSGPVGPWVQDLYTSPADAPAAGCAAGPLVAFEPTEVRPGASLVLLWPAAPRESSYLRHVDVLATGPSGEQRVARVDAGPELGPPCSGFP